MNDTTPGLISSQNPFFKLERTDLTIVRSWNVCETCRFFVNFGAMMLIFCPYRIDLTGFLISTTRFVISVSVCVLMN